ncbi:MAG: response regulator [Candidatus Omnitrophica bacterium]|nr:response regulator [Candidatus Omnitrophota bacterium]
MKFAWKLIAVMLGILAAMGVVIYHFVYLPGLESLEREIKKRFKNDIINVMDQIDRSLYERFSDLRHLASDPALRSNPPAPAAVAARLKEFADGEAALFFYDLNRVKIAGSGAAEAGEEYPFAARWADVLLGERYVMEISRSETGGDPAFYFSHPVKDAREKILGVLVSRVLVSTVYRIIEGTASLHEEYAPIIDLVNEEGLLLYSTYNKKGMLKDNLTGWESVKKALKAGGDASPQEEYFYVFVKENGYSDFKGSGWTLRAYIPKGIVFKPALELRDRIVAVLLPIAFFSILAVFVVSQSISRPLVRLKRAADRISRGEFDTGPQVRSRDEVGELARSFYKMTDELKRANLALEDWAKTLEKKVEARTMDLGQAQKAALNMLEDLQKTKEDLERTNKELQNLDQLKSHFVSTVSHELRTPLSIMKEGINLILDRIPGPVNDQQGRLLEAMKNSLYRLERIIDNLLDISKIESGKVEVRKELVELGPLLQKNLSFFEAKAKEKGIELKLNLPAEGVRVYADEDKINQVFTNLVGNALKFTGKGSVLVEARENAAEVECAVSDTGIGIEKESLPKVFDKFQQFGRTAGPGEKGTGLGLSIVKGIVELHRGRIRVESEPGRGTRFTFWLPKHTPGTLARECVASGIEQAKKKNFKLAVVAVTAAEAGPKEPAPSDPLMDELAEIVKSGLRRQGDMAFRDGTTVFVVCVDCDRDNALKMGMRLGQAANDYLVEKNLSGRAKIGVGCAAFPDDAAAGDDLLLKAKRASFQKKWLVKKKILLVDNEPDFVDMLKMRLEANDFVVTPAYDGRDALEKLKTDRFDAVLLDMLMPRMDGLEALKIIKGQYRDLPVFMITAYTTDQRFDLAMELGAAGFIRKTSDLNHEIVNIMTVLDMSDQYSVR